MADAGEAAGHLPLGPAHSNCARAELGSTPSNAEALPLTSLGAANQECVREGPSVSRSRGLPRSGRRQRVKPFLDRKAATERLLLSGRPNLSGKKKKTKQLEPTENSVLKTCFCEQSVEWWLSIRPRRRGPQMIASQKALVNQGSGRA